MAYTQKVVSGYPTPSAPTDDDGNIITLKYGAPIYGSLGKGSPSKIIGKVGMMPVESGSSHEGNYQVTWQDDPSYPKSPQLIAFQQKIASGEVQGAEGGPGAEYTSYDPATNIVTFYDTEGNITQQGQKSSAGGVPGFASSALGVVGGVGNAIGTVASNPQALVAIAIAVAAPYAAGQIAAYLTTAGLSEAAAAIAADAITSITIQTAQGVPIEKATENALTNVAISGVNSEVAKQIGTVISKPEIANAISSTVTSGLATAAKGGSQADVEKAMTAGLVSSAASTAYKEAVDSTSTIASKAVGGAAGGAVTGGTEGAILGGLTSAASALGSQLAPTPTPEPSPAPVSQAEPKNVEELLAAVDAAQKKDYVSSSTAFAGAGLIPAAAEETAVLLARLAATPAGQQVLREAATTSDKIRTAIVASGILSAGALTGFIGGQSLVPQAQTGGSTKNPAFDLIPTKGGDPGTATQARQSFAQTDPRRVDISTPDSGDIPVKVETQRVAQILNIPLADAVKLENVNPVLYNFFANSDPKSFTPADMSTMSSTNQRILESILAGQNINEGSLPDTGKYTTTVQSSPVAGLDITADQSQAETERLAKQGQPTTTSPQDAAQAPAEQDTAQAPAESATVMQVNPSTGEAIAIKSTGEIFTVTVDPSTKSGTAIKVSASTAPVTTPKTSPAPSPAPAPKPITSPPSVVEPPLAPAPISEKDKQLIELMPPKPPASKDGAPSGSAPAPITEPTPVPELPKEDVPVDVDADGKPIKTPDESVEDTGAEPKQPVYDYDPKAKPPSDVFTKTVLSPKTKSSAALGQALGTTGLTAYRGAGEIEGPGSGKPRKKVWNEESLKLKDALGV